jgi:hypothetical protein
MSLATERRGRTAAEIAFDCRVNRLVDWWVSRQHLKQVVFGGLPPHEWADWMWAIASDRSSRLTDPPPDEAMREAVIAEIDAVQHALERRRSA